MIYTSAKFLTLLIVLAALTTDIMAQGTPDVIIKSGKDKSGRNVISDSLLQAMRTPKIRTRPFEIGLNYGRWFLGNSSKYFEEGSLVDLQSCKDMFGARFSYAPLPSLSIGSLLNLMISMTPKSIHLSNEGDSLSVQASGKGGVILTFFIGAKYFFTRETFRPYIAFYPGLVYAYAKGGTASGGLSSMSKNIEQQKQKAFAFRAEGGVDYMLGEAAKIGSDIAYIRSGEFGEPAAGLKNFRGWSLSFSISYLF